MVGSILISINIDRSIPNATEIDLIGRCNLMFFDTRLQPVNTLVLGCPERTCFGYGPYQYNSPGLRILGTKTHMNLLDKMRYLLRRI